MTTALGVTVVRHLPAHMRWGHWRRKHAGEGWDKQSNLIWIEPYMTHGYTEA
jgi:hypothetical protein